jgi:hypothetical protein
MDQRSNKRKRTILDGRIVFNNRFSLIECTVRDLSDTGARIAFSHPIKIPSTFELEIPKKRLSRWACAVWSNGKEHGVMFTEVPQVDIVSEAPPSLEQAQPQDTNTPEQAVSNTSTSAEEVQPQGSNFSEQAGSDAAKLQEILEETRRRIAEITGVPTDNVRLKLKIDFGSAGLKKQ